MTVTMNHLKLLLSLLIRFIILLYYFHIVEHPQQIETFAWGVLRGRQFRPHPSGADVTRA